MVDKIKEAYKSDNQRSLDFKNKMNKAVLDNSFLREFENELKEYSINKRILNLLTNMGYVIKEHSGMGVRGSKHTSLVKTTHKHLISINFDYRRRIVIGPRDRQEQWEEENPEMAKQL